MKHFLTQKRLDEFKEELKKLKTERRLEVSEKLKNAKDLGDLSENSEYLEAREEQGRVEGRIIEIEEIIRSASIIKEGGGGGGVIDVGSTVEVVRDGKQLKFIIVGSSEAKPEDGYISNESPLGQELIGKSAGESVIIETPGGKVEYKIKKVK